MGKTPSPEGSPLGQIAVHPEFRAEAVRLTREPGTTIKQVSRDLGISYESLRKWVLPSMGSVGDAYDNAVAESFFGTMKLEVVHRHRFRTRAEAKAALFEWIELFYNRQSLHSTNGQLSPAEYERRYAAATAS